jgi:hypothetical protein
MLGSKYGVPSEVSETALSIGEGLLGHLSGEKPSEQQYEEEEQYEEEPPRQSIRDPGPAYYLRQGIKKR